MTSINEIFTTFGPEYLQRYANLMPKTHRKAIDAIISCRTEACGLALYQCEKCAESHQLYIAPVAIAIVPLANTIKLASGSKNKSSANSPVTIS